METHTHRLIITASYNRKDTDALEFAKALDDILEQLERKIGPTTFRIEEKVAGASEKLVKG